MDTTGKRREKGGNELWNGRQWIHINDVAEIWETKMYERHMGDKLKELMRG
jgi:hypothetical protein